ncbi:MAG: SoxR reducing system RseC family protein [Marinicella sp.]
MNRVARVVAQGRDSVTLQLQKVEKCAGCTGNCDKPLINLFSMKKSVFILSHNHTNYQIDDKAGLLSQKLSLGQLLVIHISDRDLSTFSGLLYLLPILLFIATLSAGHYVGKWLGLETDLTALFGLLLGFCLVFLIMKSNLIAQHLKIRPLVTILGVNGTKD